MKFDLENAKEVLKWKIAKAEEKKYVPLYRLSCDITTNSGTAATIHLYTSVKPDKSDNDMIDPEDNSAVWNSSLFINKDPSDLCDIMSRPSTDVETQPHFYVFSQDSGNFITSTQAGNYDVDLSTLKLTAVGSAVIGYELVVQNPQDKTNKIFTYDYDNDDFVKCYHYMTYYSAGSYSARLYFNSETVDLVKDSYYGYVTTEASIEYFYPINYLVGYNGWKTGTSSYDVRCILGFSYDGSGNQYYFDTKNLAIPFSTVGIGDFPYFNSNSKLVSVNASTTVLENNVYLNSKNEMFVNVKATDIPVATESVSGTIKASENSQNYYGVYLNNNVMNLSIARNGTNYPGGVYLNSGSTLEKNQDFYIYSSYDSDSKTSGFNEDNSTVLYYVIVDTPYDLSEGTMRGNNLFWKTPPNILGAFACTIYTNINGSKDIKISEQSSAYYYIEEYDDDPSYGYNINFYNSSISTNAHYIASDNIYKQLLSTLGVSSLNYEKMMFLQQYYNDGSTQEFQNVGFIFGEWPTDGGTKTGITGETVKGRVNTNCFSIQPKLSTDTSDYHGTFTSDFDQVYLSYDTNCESMLTDTSSGYYPLYSGSYVSTENASSYQYTDTIYTLTKSEQTYNIDGKQYIQADADGASGGAYVDLNNYYTKDEIGDLTTDLKTLFESKLSS